METYTLTALRKDLYRIVDRILETGEPVELERNGQRLLLVPEQRPSRLARLPRRQGIVGDPDTLVDAETAQWNEARNLD